MTPSAIELLREPELAITPITATTASGKGYSHDELRHFRIGHDDIDKLIIRVYESGRTRKGKKGKNKGKVIHTKPTLTKNLRQHIQDASFEDSIERTPTFTMVVHDPDWEILNSGITDEPFDINPGGIKRRWYTLVNVAVNGDDITLTFATRNAVLLMHEHRPMKANRKRMTRAQFVRALVRRVKYVKIPYYASEMNKKQKQDKLSDKTENQKDSDRNSGFTASDKITVAGANASANQRKVIGQVCQAGIDMKAPGLVIVAAIMTITVETLAGDNQGSSSRYLGPFEQNPGDGWPGTNNAYTDACGNKKLGVKQGGFFGMAIPAWAANPNQDLGIFCQKVQGASASLNPLNSDYAQKANSYRQEAQHSVNAFGGIDVDDPGSSTPGTVDVKEKFEFEVPDPNGEKKKENYLDAIYRLADEVKWSAFWVKDELHFESQDDLFKQRAKKRLRRFEDGIESVSFEWDRVEKVDNMILSVRMERWVSPVGTVVVFDEGGPGKGRWLVGSIRRSIFDQLGEVTLTKPLKEQLEPINVGQKSIEPTATPSGPVGDLPPNGDLLSLVREDMTPQQIIEQIVLPAAQDFHMTAGIDATAVAKANDSHSNCVAGSNPCRTSWHKGPGDKQYAVDCSDGAGDAGSANMDALAEFLLTGFRIGDGRLVSPHAQPYTPAPENAQTDYHKGFAFQVIHRSMTGGDHYDHVHCGVQKLTLAKPGI